MPITASTRGMTLIEVVVAASLLLTVASGLIPVLVQTHRFVTGAELMTTAALAASSHAATLLAAPWGRDGAGNILPAPALDPSPPDSLARDAPGYVDWLDSSGDVAGAGTGPKLTRRWAIRPVPAALETRAIEVCVFAWPTRDGQAPLACVATARVRQP